MDALQCGRPRIKKGRFVCVRVHAAAAAITLGFAGFAVPAHAQGTAYEGARIIVGDGRVIENGTIVVDGARITQAGSATDVKVPAGAKRVSLTGKTVMPMIIDTHVHLSGKRETLVRDLKQRAYWGVSTAMSMGTDNLELLPMRDEVIPGAARFMSAGRGITRPEPLRPTIFINSPEEGRKAIQENAKLKVDIVKIWVDDRNGKVQKITPDQYAAIIDEAHKLKIRITAHIFTWKTRRGSCAPGSTPSPTAFATWTSTTRPSRCSSSGRISSSTRTCRIAA